MSRIVFLGLLCMQVACSVRPGIRWIIPESFNGCVSVYFQVTDAPALPTEAGWLLVNVPSQGGVLRTSSQPEWGEGLISEFWVQTNAGRAKVTPTCRSPTSSNVAEGTVDQGYCFGKVSELDCKAVGRKIPH